jgi:hypothetical protein
MAQQKAAEEINSKLRAGARVKQSSKQENLYTKTRTAKTKLPQNESGERNV